MIHPLHPLKVIKGDKASRVTKLQLPLPQVHLLKETKASRLIKAEEDSKVIKVDSRIFATPPKLK
tara:strand:+ start:626 stop:820 length:195 start_codon:yes stop_codon:yes gene_type:complete